MTLKGLAHNVLQRDTSGTNNGTDLHIPSQKPDTSFPLSQAVMDEYHERAAIMEFGAGMTKGAAEAAAFADCQRNQSFKLLTC